MGYAQHLCAKWGRAQLRRNGSSQGHAKYPCKACHHPGRFVPAAGAKAVQYAQVEKLLGERNSPRRIVRATGVGRRTIAKLLKKAAAAPPPRPKLRPKKGEKKRWAALERDELRSFVGRKKQKVWRWLAVERHARRTVAWAVGTRGAATARRLWAARPVQYRGPRGGYFADAWKAYVGVLPRGPHRPCPKGESQTSIVEAVNGSLRQRCAVLGAQSLLV